MDLKERIKTLVEDIIHPISTAVTNELARVEADYKAAVAALESRVTALETELAGVKASEPPKTA